MNKIIVAIDNILIFPAYLCLHSYITRKIFHYYGADYRWGDEKSQNLDIQHSNLGFGLFHKALVRNLRPKRILCVGSMYGFIPYMLASGCYENKVGHVDFVDAGYDVNTGDKHHYGGQGVWRRVDTTSYFNYLLDSKYITTYVMTSKDFAKKYSYQYEYIYLDADHSYKGAISDFRLFWPRLSENGIFSFHKIHFKQKMMGLKFEYWKLWDDLKNMQYKFEIVTGYHDLGFIQKKENTRTPKKY